MAALEETGLIAPKATAQSKGPWFGLLAAAAGFALTVLVFYPGYSTADARYVYADAIAWRFGDWQSPAMAVVWRLIDPGLPAGAEEFAVARRLRR